MATPSDLAGGGLQSASGRRRRLWWLSAAIGLVVIILAVWAVLALSVPGLRRAAIAGNEASAIGYVQAVASAERLAAGFNRGFSLPLSCLSDPGQCPPAVSTMPLLAASLTDSYVTYFTVSSSPTSDEIAAGGAVARSIKNWVLVVLPRQPGVTGQRVFCTDRTGEIFFTPDTNTLPDTSAGRCGNAQPLR